MCGNNGVYSMFFGIMFDDVLIFDKLTFLFLSFRVSAGGGEGTVWRKCTGVFFVCVGIGLRDSIL